MLVEQAIHGVRLGTFSYTVSGPGDDEPFLDPHPSDDVPLDYGSDDDADSGLGHADAFDDLLDGDDDLSDDDEYMDGDETNT